MEKKRLALSVLGVMVIALSACLPSTPKVPPTFIVGEAYTQGAATLFAGLTETAINSQGISDPTSTPEPTGTTAPRTPAPTRTPVPQSPTATGLAFPTLPPVTPTGPRTTPPTDTPAPTFEFSFRDDFESPTGWAEVDEINFEVGYSFGHYRMFVGLVTGDSPIFSIRQREYADLTITVDVIRQEGPQNGYYGVLCRFIDSDNYYRFVVSPDGNYSIGKKSGGAYTELAAGLDGEIYLKDKVNSIRAACLGDRLVLYINGKQVLAATDDAHQSGFVGLAAGTLDTAGLIVYFDNYEVRKP